MAEPALLSGCRGLILGVSGENSVGFACARLFRELGAEVAATYRPGREQSCAPLLQAIGARGYAVDALQPETLGAALAELERHFGRLDFLVHGWVGADPKLLEAPLTEVGWPDFATVLRVGAHSFIDACGQARPLLARSAHGRVVALTSESDARITPRYHVLGIAKAALRSAVHYLAAELGPDGILCNAASFSLIPTDGAARTVGDEAAAKTAALIARRAPTRRATTLDDVSHTVAWLCSPLLKNVSAQVLTADGGFSRLYFT